jgi:UDP-glucose 4-epimerase
MRKILVTGGTGFIGQNLVKKLLAENCFVYVLTRQEGCYAHNNRISYIHGNFTQPQQFAVLLTEVDAVFHLAVTTTPGNSNEKVIYDAKSNLLGSLTLIEQAAQAGVRRFIFTSSGGSVYGLNGGYPIPEDHPTDPISAHGVSKLAIEKYLAIYQHLYGMDYRIARGSNPYGEGQDPNRGQGFIAYALGCIAQDREIVVWGDGSVRRDYLYVKDMVGALWLLLQDNRQQKIYNVGSGQSHSIDQILSILELVTDKKANVRYEKGRSADVPDNCLDISLIQENLGWKPVTKFLAGVDKTWKWICNQLHKEHSEIFYLTKNTFQERTK